ncbi:alcohol dehydrogenase [Bacillus sp. RO3]|nr:alcohol dehydrogenase [Bacillus sp. RO3]
MNQQSLMLTGKKQLEWMKEEIKRIKEDEILIRTVAGAISIGAEMPQYEESDVTDQNPRYPRGTGYESYGRVMETGEGVTDIKAGDHVLAFYGHKQAAVVKANKVVKVPGDVPYDHALLNTLSCDAGKGVLKLKPRRKDKVLVTGAGTMGLLTLHFLKSYMKVERVDVLEPDESRRAVAHTFGATQTYGDRGQVPEAVYDYGLECSASSDAFQALLRSLKQRGEACILSDGNKDLFFLNEAFYERELKIVGSSDGWDYRKHSEWFFKEQVNAPYVTRIFEHAISSEDLIECFAELSERKIKPLKVLVRYEKD